MADSSTDPAVTIEADELLRVWFTDDLADDPTGVTEGTGGTGDTGGPAGSRPPALELPWLWVRDHSRHPSAHDHHTGQRTIDTFGLDPHLRPTRTECVDGEIRVWWPGDGPPSVLPIGLLAALRVDPSGGTADAGPPVEPDLWDRGDEVEGAPVPFGRPGAAPIDEIVDHLARRGFVVLSGVPTDEGGVVAVAEAIGYVRRTIFGDIWPLASDLTDHADSAYGTETLEPHTDGSYSHDGPGLQLFVCGERTGTGGESVLVDGFAAAQHLRAVDPEAFDLLSTVEVPAHYREPGVDLRARRPTIRLRGPGGAVEQVTFNNYDRSPFVAAPDRLLAWYRAYGAFHRLISDRSRWWSHRLEPGQALVFDNWRCLHGRMGFTGRRAFLGCYLNHEDLESRIRVGSSGSAGTSG